MMQILGVNFGLSVSTSELRRKITESGWRVEQVKFDSAKDRYICKAISARGKRLERPGKTERLALANMFLAVQARDSSVRLGRWQTNFTDRLQAIAEAYSKAPTYTAKASEPFLALAHDCTRRADVLSRHLEIEIVNDPEPYKSPEKLIDDIRKRRQLVVSRAGTVGHPIWSEQEVVAYRICHDVLGYAAANAGWDWEGENEAFAHHVHLLSEQAQMALFTESLALSAYNTFYHAYGPQKVATFPQFMNEAQTGENPHRGFRGVHPDESFPPIEMPSVKPIVSMLSSVDDMHYAAGVDPSWRDPNYRWQSQIEPMQMDNGLTIKQTYGDPLGSERGYEMAQRLYQPNPAERPWDQIADQGLQGQIEGNRQAGGPAFTNQEFEYLKTQLPSEYQRMRTAISNAFRAVLLSPQTELFNNAVHYQALSHSNMQVPPGTDDPHQYFKALDTVRRRYNVERWEEQNPGRGEEAPTHLAYAKFIKAFIKYVGEMKQLPHPEAQDLAMRIIGEMKQQEEGRLNEKDEQLPPDKRMFPWEMDSQSGEAVAKNLQALLAAHRKKQDFAVPEGPLQQLVARQTEKGETIQDSSQAQAVPDLPGLPGPRRYPGIMYGQLAAISRIEPYIDDILKAALEDVHNHDATGHHFRSTLLQLSIPGVGPKVTSFAWLLLKPLTSQLATIDFHMMNVMGSTEDSPKKRDYFGWERAFRDRLNAMGYHDVPTGLGQWLLWDNERTGPGNHQDHAALSPLNPTPWHAVDWHPGLPKNPGWGDQQEWWALTKPLQDQAMENYSQLIAPKTPLNAVPYQGMPKWGIGGVPEDPAIPGSTLSKVAGWSAPMAAPRTPYFVHPFTGEKISGLPGQTIMAHARQTLGLSVPEIWQQLELAEAGKV